MFKINFALLCALRVIGFCLISQIAMAYAPLMPTNLNLKVENTTPHLQQNYVVRAGMPLSRSQNKTSTNDFAIVDDGGTAVPAQFRILARWNAAINDTNAPIQWVLASFPATVSAHSSRVYRLRIDASINNPAAPNPISVTQDNGGVVVNTGIANFEIPSSGSAVLSRARSGEGDTTVIGSEFEIEIAGQTYQNMAEVRHVTVEHQDALSAVVVVHTQIAIANPEIAPLALTRRYVFRAGSNAAEVRSWLDWESQRCELGVIQCNGATNAIRIDRWRERLFTFLGSGANVSLYDNTELAPTTVNIASGQTAHLRQLRRPNRIAPLRFEARQTDASIRTGTAANGGLLVASGSEGRLAIGLKSMQDFEPQALRLLSDQSLAIDLIDDGIWLGAKQGVYAEYAIALYPPITPLQNILDDLWPKLNAPLMALPAPEWVVATLAVDEIPVGNLPAPWNQFDQVLNTTLDRTESLRQELGLNGLMTHGLFPRYWGNPILSDEIDCGDNDPTPLDDWDDVYWCSTWTDYHNVASNSFYAAIRYADVGRLQQISFPAALRSLHTQVIQCAPDDNNFYCGLAPSGYGGYRADFNSSHQYFDNLILYYWMTGDETVWKTLKRGANNMRGYLCPGRGNNPPGPACNPSAPITDQFAGVNGRVAGQAYELFRFIGLASNDASFLHDWNSNSARMLTQNYAEGVRNNRTLGLIEPSGGGDVSIINAAGTYYTTQLWMSALYDLNLLHRLEIQTQNAALGTPALTPTQVQINFANTIWAASQIPPANNTVAGIIPESLRFTFSEPRIGGTITALEPGWAPNVMPVPCNDACLYPESKAALSASLMRGADVSNDLAMRQFGIEMSLQALNRLQATSQPLNKETGIALTKLHAAIARITDTEIVFENSFE